MQDKQGQTVLRSAGPLCSRTRQTRVLTACSQIRLNPEREVALSHDVAQSWVPPAPVAGVTAPAAKLEELRAVEWQLKGSAPSGKTTSDLLALVDMALRSNPQTRVAWNRAHAAAAQYGRSWSNTYPRVVGEAVGGYFKLPLQFPG